MCLLYSPHPQSISLEEMEVHLKEWGLDYVKQVFVEDGVQVGQLFFHDPDNNMIGERGCARVFVGQPFDP